MNADGATCAFAFAGRPMLADLSGALVIADAATLVVADLHFEKGSAFARRGLPLPPYDTRATLAALADALARHRPGRVVCLGDAFHDGDGPARLGAAERAELARLARGRDWLWLAGNHDPAPGVDGIGRIAEAWRDGALCLRHRADAAAVDAGEVSGHFHPVVHVRARGRSQLRRCFVVSAERLILPSFGAYTGGLDVRDPAIAGLFPAGFIALAIGRTRLQPLPFAGGGGHGELIAAPL